MATVNRSTIQARDAEVISGIQKHLMNVASISLNGVSYTPAALIQLVQSEIDAANAATQAKTAFSQAAQANQAAHAKVAPVITALRTYVINLMGTQGTTLDDFGFSPPKAHKVLTAAEKAAAAAKRKATRAARHTMGSNQKLTARLYEHEFIELHAFA